MRYTLTIHPVVKNLDRAFDLKFDLIPKQNALFDERLRLLSIKNPHAFTRLTTVVSQDKPKIDRINKILKKVNIAFSEVNSFYRIAKTTTPSNFEEWLLGIGSDPYDYDILDLEELGTMPINKSWKILLAYFREKEENSNNIRALNKMGTICLKLKQYKDAIYYFKRIFNIHPNDRRALHGLGKVALETKNYTLAERWFRRILWIKFNDIYGLHGIGRVALAEKKYSKAEHHFKKVLRIHPEDILSVDWLGCIALIKRDYFEANYWFRKNKSPRAIPNISSYRFTNHAKKKCYEHGISLRDLKNALKNNYYVGMYISGEARIYVICKNALYQLRTDTKSNTVITIIQIHKY